MQHRNIHTGRPSATSKHFREQVHSALRHPSRSRDADGTTLTVYSTRVTGPVMLVGSLVRAHDDWSVEQILRTSAGHLADQVSMLPDGEPGDRAAWIGGLAKRVYNEHPGMRRTTPAPEHGAAWLPEGDDRYSGHHGFEILQPHDHFFLHDLGYARDALDSYRTWMRLRDEGVIPHGVRFQVGLPGPESATRPFTRTPADFELLWTAYIAALRAEIARICAVIPARELAIQIDCTRETAACEGAPEAERYFSDSDLTNLPEDPLARMAGGLRELTTAIPAEAWLGIHVCYGSLGHQPEQSADSAHFAPIQDLQVAVDMVNAAAAFCRRRVDYAHIPVQINNYTDEHYRPLTDLNIGSTRLYLGLIDSYGGLPGIRERIKLASRYYQNFGIATPCGFGRRPTNDTADLLALHAVASQDLKTQLKADQAT